MTRTTTTVRTSHGKIAMHQSSGTDLAVVLLHGNSMSADAFQRQFDAAIARRYRLVAVDLPGHGRSDNAKDPARSYTVPGFASAVHEALAAAGIDEAVLCGWSLGGHVALELASTWKGARGIVLTGTPPVSPTPAGIFTGFAENPLFPLCFSPSLDADGVATLARAFFGEAPPAFALADLARTDGRARTTMLESFMAGVAADERALVETSNIPVAVIDGEAEPFVRPGYLDSLRFANLWQGTVHTIVDAGHAPFWQNARAYNSLLLNFLRSVTGTADRATPRRVAASARQRKARAA